MARAHPNGIGPSSIIRVGLPTIVNPQIRSIPASPRRGAHGVGSIDRVERRVQGVVPDGIELELSYSGHYLTDITREINQVSLLSPT